MKLGEVISCEKVLFLTSCLKTNPKIKKDTKYITSKIVSNMVLLPNTFPPGQVYATIFFRWIITVTLIKEEDQMYIKIVDF